MKKKIIILTLTILTIGLLKILGINLDKEAEMRSEKMYAYNKNDFRLLSKPTTKSKVQGESAPQFSSAVEFEKKSIIKGAESIIIKNKDNAESSVIIFIHGFASSPAAFSSLIKDIKTKTKSDIYAPLLPFHGRNLQTLTKLDNQILLNYLDNLLQHLAKTYKNVTVVSLSFSGALTAKLAFDNKIPNNVKIILYSPAFYIKSNNLPKRSIAKIYSYWRNYCNYNLLGCGYPSYSSADAYAKPEFAKEKSFKYVNLKSLLTMYKFDSQNQSILSLISRHYDIIIAADDNRVSYDRIKFMCNKNSKYCHLHSFKSGKHMIHWGKNKEKFINTILQIHKRTVNLYGTGVRIKDDGV